MKFNSVVLLKKTRPYKNSVQFHWPSQRAANVLQKNILGAQSWKPNQNNSSNVLLPEYYLTCVDDVF